MFTASSAPHQKQLQWLHFLEALLASEVERAVKSSAQAEDLRLGNSSESLPVSHKLRLSSVHPVFLMTCLPTSANLKLAVQHYNQLVVFLRMSETKAMEVQLGYWRQRIGYCFGFSRIQSHRHRWQRTEGLVGESETGNPILRGTCVQAVNLFGCFTWCFIYHLCNVLRRSSEEKITEESNWCPVALDGGSHFVGVVDPGIAVRQNSNVKVLQNCVDNSSCNCRVRNRCERPKGIQRKSWFLEGLEELERYGWALD